MSIYIVTSASGPQQWVGRSEDEAITQHTKAFPGEDIQEVWLSVRDTDPAWPGPCARCGGAVPTEDAPGKWPGAISRVDGETYICSDCGLAEEMFLMENPGKPLPPLRDPLV